MLLPYPPFEPPSIITAWPKLDWETFAEAGYRWVPPDPPGEWKWKLPTKRKPGEWLWKEHFGKWESLPGLSDQNRGLKAVGTWNYVTHPSFEVISLAHDLRAGEGRRRWVPNLPHTLVAGTLSPGLHPWDLIEHVRAGGIVEAHNAFFEWCVWNLHCVPKWGWPPLRIEQMRCSMAKCRYMSYPGGLHDAGDVLHIPQAERKDPEGEKLVKKLTTPRNPTKGNPALRWTPFTASEEFAAFYAYNEQDIVAEGAVSARVPDLTPREHTIWQFDFRCNARGMFIDRPAVDDCISIIEQAYAKYNARLADITGNAAKSASEAAKILRWMAHQGIHLTELDEETVEDALTKAYPPAVLEVLRIRQLLAFGSVKKLYAMRSHQCSDGRLRDQYIYCGAHTKLWNGRYVQPANLFKGEFSHPDQVTLALSIIATRSLEVVEAAYGDALELVAGCLRSMIRAAPGHKLISADFTAIQAVVTACLAGEQWRIDVFNTHGKIYEAQAAMLTGKTLEYYAQYRAENKKHHSDRQDYGKLPVLSGDFGAWIGGWKRFGADKILGEDANIKAAILKLRGTIPNIVELWGGQTRDKFSSNERPQLYGLEGAAISAVLSPGQCFGYRGVRYQMHGDTLYCHPPSGGFLQYHSPRIEPSQRDHASPWELELRYQGWNSNPKKGRGGWEWMKLYGGVCTQNVVANMSRERQADSLVALDTAEPRAYPIVMHTHDEGVAETPDDPRWNKEEYTAIVRNSHPGWAHFPDGSPWPIRVPTAWEAYTYGKWEL